MMKTTTLAISGAAAILTLGCATGALAQAKPAAAAPAAAVPAAATPALTASIPGVCIIQREKILAGSTVGRSVQTRMGQLQSQAQAEINAEAQTFQADA